MKGFENQSYLVAYIISNAVAVFLLFAAWKWPKLSRTLFSLLFAWACWTNWSIAVSSPQDYLEYASLTFLPVYEDFIRGWFSEHIALVVGFIATVQGLIAIALTLKGWIYKLGCVAAIIFLLSITPLGVGSAFPCTLIMAIAILILLRNQHSYLWQIEKPVLSPGID